MAPHHIGSLMKGKAFYPQHGKTDVMAKGAALPITDPISGDDPLSNTCAIIGCGLHTYYIPEASMGFLCSAASDAVPQQKRVLAQAKSLASSPLIGGS